MLSTGPMTSHRPERELRMELLLGVAGACQPVKPRAPHANLLLVEDDEVLAPLVANHVTHSGYAVACGRRS